MSEFKTDNWIKKENDQELLLDELDKRKFKVGDWVKKREIQKTFKCEIHKEKWDELPDCFQVEKVTKYYVYGPNDFGFMPSRFEKVENPNNESKKTQDNENGKLWTVSFDLPLPKKAKENEMPELKIGDEFEVVCGFYSEKHERFCTKDIVVYEGICPKNESRYRFHCKANKLKTFTLQPKDVRYHLKQSKKDMKYTIEQIKYLQETYKNKNCHPDVKEFISKTLENQKSLYRKEFFQGLKEDIDMFNRTMPHSSSIFPENKDYNVIRFMFKTGKYYIKLEEKHLLLEVVEIPYQQGLSTRFSTMEEINF